MEIESLARTLAPLHNHSISGTGRADAGPVATRRSPSGASVDSDVGSVVVAFSDEGRALSQLSATGDATEADDSATPTNQPASEERVTESGSKSTSPSSSDELSDEEQQEVRELRARDAEVRAHENAHKAAAGRHSRGGPTFDYQKGPDGKQYAVGGEVSIDTAPVAGDPDATILKMRQVRRAALAPANPSSQDRRVASEASQAEAAARSEKLKQDGEANEAGTRRTVPTAYTDPREDEERKGQRFDQTA